MTNSASYYHQSNNHHPLFSTTYHADRSIDRTHAHIRLFTLNVHSVLRIGWVMEWRIEDHVERIKNRLEKGRRVLSTLEHLTTYDIENVEPDMDQIALHPPRPGDRFYVATDERDPDALRVIQDGGGVFLSDLLEMEDRRTVGWPLMLTDVRALVERLVLSHSAYFYGHMLSSYSGRVVNMRAARGADRRTAFID